MSKNGAVILAGGQGTRMRSDKPKVMAQVLFKPMIDWVIDAAKEAGIEDICVVTGYGADLLENHLNGRTQTVHQTERLGTGHAVMQAKDFIAAHTGGNILILNGDAPFADAKTIRDALAQHENNRCAQTVISACVEKPHGYGRIVRDDKGTFLCIAEEASATEEIKKINEINSGVMWFDADTLSEVLCKLKNDNTKGEYYLTDTVDILLGEGKKVAAFTSENPDAVLGANTRVQLHELNEIARQKSLEKYMLAGVDIPFTDGVIITPDCEIGKDTQILPGTIIKNGCVIGRDCIIGPSSMIDDCKIGDDCTLNRVQAENSIIENGADLGPFMHVRPNSHIGKNVHCGNFTEVKNSTIGDKTSISHLTYVGDSDVGSGVNFGCGTVTSNYDGLNKYRTVIEDNCFIGCNTNLIAPVKIGKNAYTAAGSTITHDVPPMNLAIARERQTNKEGWVEKTGRKK
ncbi:MAG: UDP-N-acetylglucosamine diphosphorylase/glucosamine-1-phosphate N-acetyltransferase [Ruminococcaceae bacterium]|nr:UDP-N-acetylglucosamine diphosphorylase/glucosamine-1-phosphate N-acetyltransferase [Oscillospiraceae bacterium]